MHQESGTIRVGVGGWTYEPWRGNFYPAGLAQQRELEYASRRLTVIEINGVALNALDYPADFREDGGFTTRVISLDARLDQLIAAGQTVQVTVFNSLTNLRSAPFSFTR